ncbi:hypothetical protein PR202_ga26025 [Eleusine coracana subsp. coracana]|uniref:RRM domain-containing protein n=1 Tax=Eleusine coracana subsp. coracana TaxID=191504 RepID=A0AAV5DCI6_ELECO|nr:hypothetical protein PR202_ga26025 [Eleusine coracana subsp. coracana]
MADCFDTGAELAGELGEEGATSTRARLSLLYLVFGGGAAAVEEMLSGDIPPNQTIYLRNLNEKLKKEELKRSLYALCSQYGRILDLVALKTPKLRGQAWVVFSEITAATNAFRGLQEFDFYGKRMGNQASRQGKVPHEEAAPPNNILFIQNLPNETTPMMLQLLFQQYPGFREVRMIEAKPGIAFVEFEDDSQSNVAMQALQGFKIAPEYPMVISFAKK